MLADGLIGAPIPTHAHIDPANQGPVVGSPQIVEALFARRIDNDVYYRLAAADDQASRKAIASLNQLGSSVPERFDPYQETDDGLKVSPQSYPERSYLDFKTYRTNLETSLGVLGRKLAARRPFKLEKPEGPAAEVAPDTAAWHELETIRDGLEQRSKDPELESAHRAASLQPGTAYVQLLTSLGERE